MECQRSGGLPAMRVRPGCRARASGRCGARAAASGEAAGSRFSIRASMSSLPPPPKPPKPTPVAPPKAPPAPAKPPAARPQAALTPDLVVLGLVLLAATALHAAALTLPFFADDYLFLDQVRHRSLFAVLVAPDPIGNFFRPLGRQVYFWGLAHLTRQSPLAFHAVNLGLFIASVALLFSITRRMAGLAAAAIAGSFVALHYAADVPVRWVSGSQDLMATAGALAALWLLQLGRRAWAGVLLFLALLCKETAVLTPLIGVFVAREGREPWRDSARRAWPLFAGAAAWALLYLAMGSRHRGAASPGEALAGVLPALVHLGQVTLGAEWRADAKTRFLHFWPPLVPLLIALVAIFRARPRVVRAEKRSKQKERAARRARESAL